jgi:hypothetical protein
MGRYTTTKEVWRNLGVDAYTKVRDEAVGNSGSASYSLDYQNVISGSETITPTGSGYSINYDDGTISYTASTTQSVIASYDYGDIPDSEMQLLVNEAESELDMLTGRTFTLATGTEYIDVNNQTTFFTKNYPVIGITVSANINGITDSPSWSTSTEGIGNDYLMDDNDKLIGKFEYIDNPPLNGQKMLKVVYSYGYATIPNTVRELANLLTLRKMINSSVYKAIIKGRDNFTPVRLQEIENRINQIAAGLRKQNISRI